MLYPDLPLALQKDEKGEYLKSLFQEIIDACGTLSPLELRIASIYVIAISRGLSRIKPEDYAEIRKELTTRD